MTDSHNEAAPARRIGLVRAGIGLAQGLALYGLIRADEAKAWPATEPQLYIPLLMVTLTLPLLLLSGVGALRRKALMIWPIAAVAVVGLLAWHNAARRSLEGAQEPTFPLVLAIGAILFIGHHLVAAADQDRRRIADYDTYFDLSWKHGVQLAFSGAFTLVFWGLLYLGSALFGLIGVKVFQDLIREAWFAAPATTVVFAFAVHITDVRPALIRGARTIALTLLAWLTPLMALIGAGFLIALPFTGLEPLWDTSSATGILLSAAATLIILTNAAYQDGKAEVPVILKWGARVAAVLPAPLVLIAAYGLALRVGQYGWTPDRVIAAACVLAGAAYAGGYVFAALRKGPWMRPLERTNVAVAVLVLVVLVALFTPLADPARLSVNSQVRRLESGRVAADTFDYAFLKFDAADYGRRALDRLETSSNPAIAKRAAEAEKLTNRYDRGPTTPPADLERRITVYPAGRVLPPGFLSAEVRAQADECATAKCEAYFMDMDGNGREEVLLTTPGRQMLLFDQVAVGAWRRVGWLAPNYCPGILEALRAGTFKPVPSRWKSLEVGGQTLSVEQRDGTCAEPNS